MPSALNAENFFSDIQYFIEHFKYNFTVYSEMKCQRNVGHVGYWEIV